MPLPIPSADLPPVERLREIVRCLRTPGGCPWDIEQTHQSLIPCLLEEAYEVAEAIREDDDEHLREELGDLLLQPIIHAEIARGEERFDLDDVAREISEKLIRRHPHVFGESDAGDTASVLAQWDEIKKQERGGEDAPAKPFLDGVGKGLPALARCAEMTKKVAKIGFDWEDADGVFAKIDEEIGEVKEALSENDEAHIEEEIGDLLFVVANLARKLNKDPETLLDAANQKFARRFAAVEKHLADQDVSLEEAGLSEMEEAWQTIKKR